MAQPKVAGQHGIQVAQWLQWADEDYLAARVLLLRGFVLQGAMVANTAIEKYLKTGLLARNRGFANSHDVECLYKELQSTGPVPSINLGFLSVLVKAYKLRYPDTLPVGFNIALTTIKFLTALDETVFALRRGFKFQRGDGRPVTTLLDMLLTKGDEAILDRNSSFGKCSRADLFAQTTSCYEMRVVSSDEIYVAKYDAGPITDDGIIDVEGLKPGMTTSP